jgi:transposase-like protein
MPSTAGMTRESLHRPHRSRRQGTLRRVRQAWGQRYPGIVRLWENAWADFVPLLAFEIEVRKVIFSTHEIVNPQGRVCGVSSW